MENNSNQVVHSYYAKTIGSSPKAEMASEQKLQIDLAELFIYHLFKLIGVGASEVHIIPDCRRSDRVYLATKLSENQF